MSVVIIGGGHNGLVAAGLLAKAGQKPLVLERAPRVGGATVTEEIHPGFRVSSIAHTAGPLRASIVRDLGLAIETIEPEARVFVPTADGRGLTLWGDAEKTAGELRAFSAADASRYPEFQRSLARVSGLLARVLEATPPDVDAPDLRDLWSLAGLGLGFRGLGKEDARRLLRWGPMAVADFAAEWFESEPLRAVLAARAITGAFAGPWSAGTTANLLLQAAASGGSAAGSTVLVKGGLGALADALAAAAQRAGATIRTSAEVVRITTVDGRVTGVVLASGEEIAATTVVSGTDVQRTTLRLLDPAVFDPDELHRLRTYQQTGMAAKVNFALGALPAFRAAAGRTDVVSGRIQIGGDVETLERAYDDAKYGAVSKRPYLDVTIPSLADPSLAPPGKHVMSVYAQYAPARLRGGDWNAQRDALGDVVLRTLEEHAPGIGGLVLARQILTPLDLEKTYGLTGGHPLHGEPSLNQLFLMRPLLGWARYRTPIKGLYLCSASSHPGGGVTGGPGANAAREILRDLG